MTVYFGEPYPGFFKTWEQQTADEAFSVIAAGSGDDRLIWDPTDPETTISALTSTLTVPTTADSEISDTCISYEISSSGNTTLESLATTPVRPQVGDRYIHVATDETYTWDGACWVNVALMTHVDIELDAEIPADAVCVAVGEPTEEERAAVAYEKAMKVVG